jgi:hypothetical protein
MLVTKTQRGDRVAVLKELARRAPVFGFFIVFDLWMHKITNRSRAEKVEAIGMHIGSRGARIARIAEYKRTPAGIVFTDPYEIDMRKEAAVDPYAEILVSVPPSSGRPS